MVARHVVPLDSISIEVVQDTNADLIAITVVGLGLRNGLFASSVRPEPLTPDVSLPLARGPGDSLNSVVDAATGPKVAPSVADSDTTEKQGLLIVVERNRVPTLKLAVFLSLMTSKVAALNVIDFVSENVGAAFVIELVGASAGASVQNGFACRIARRWLGPALLSQDRPVDLGPILNWSLSHCPLCHLRLIDDSHCLGLPPGGKVWTPGWQLLLGLLPELLWCNLLLWLLLWWWSILRWRRPVLGWERPPGRLVGTEKVPHVVEEPALRIRIGGRGRYRHRRKNY